MSESPRSECISCGTCCLKGGPVLHHQDKSIIRNGRVGYEHLVTIRKGELVFDPVTDRLQPSAQELIKVRGQDGNWSCRFLNKEHFTCTIYEYRFLECRLLKCWDPGDLVAVIGRDTVTRTDLINAGDPVLEIIERHEQECSYAKLEESITAWLAAADRPALSAQFSRFVRYDLALRAFAVSELGLPREFEHFVFGRPVSKYLRSRGIPTSAVLRRS